MAEHIATIKLNSGQGGFYDELTNIHLTVANPIAHLYAGQNFTNIRKGIAVNHLILVEGTLGPDPRPYRMVRVGNHLEIDLRPEAFAKKKAAKTVDVVLKKETEEVKEEPKKTETAKAAPEKAEVAPKAEEVVAEEPAKEAEAEEKKAAKKAPAKRATKKAAKKAEEE